MALHLACLKDCETMQEATRSRIIGAAEGLFYEHGLRSVSVDAIAARAGVTKRTLYYHFESKDALIAACGRRHRRAPARLTVGPGPGRSPGPV